MSPTLGESIQEKINYTLPLLFTFFRICDFKPLHGYHKRNGEQCWLSTFEVFEYNNWDLDGRGTKRSSIVIGPEAGLYWLSSRTFEEGISCFKLIMILLKRGLAKKWRLNPRNACLSVYVRFHGQVTLFFYNILWFHIHIIVTNFPPLLSSQVLKIWNR